MLLSLERLRDDFTRALNRGGVLKFPLGENRTCVRALILSDFLAL